MSPVASTSDGSDPFEPFALPLLVFVLVSTVGGGGGVWLWSNNRSVAYGAGVALVVLLAVATWRWWRRRDRRRMARNINAGLKGTKVPAWVRGIKLDPMGDVVTVEIVHDSETHLTELQQRKAARVATDRLQTSMEVHKYRAQERQPRLTLRRVASAVKLPKSVAMPLAFEDLDPKRIAFGQGEAGEAFWDLAQAPHAIVTGKTGMGKTVATLVLIIGALLRGYEVHVIDPKRRALRMLQGWPGVTRYGDSIGAESAKQMAEAIAVVHAEMEARNSLSDAELAKLARLLLVVDEMFDLVVNLNHLHKSTKGNTGEHPEIMHLAQIVALGREVGIHVLVGLQRADVKAMGTMGGFMRSNMDQRITLGPLDLDGAQMIWAGDAPACMATADIKGRALVSTTEGPAPAQVWRVDLDDAEVVAIIKAAIPRKEYPRANGLDRLGRRRATHSA